MNKHAALTDLIVFGIYSFILVVISGLMIYVAATTKTELLSKAPTLQKTFTGTNVTNVINDTFGKVGLSYQMLKWVTVMVMIGMVLSIMITSALIKNNPAWFVAYILVVVISVIIAVPLSNAYEEIYQNPTISSGFTGLFGATWIMLHLPIWTMVIGFIAGIFLFINIDWTLL